MYLPSLTQPWKMVFLGLVGCVLSAAGASAQQPGFMEAMVPPNSVYSLPGYNYQFYLGTSVPTMYGRTFVGVTIPFTPAPQIFSPQAYPGYATPAWMGGSWTSSGYLTGGSYVGSAGAGMSTQDRLAAAQKAATQMRQAQRAARDVIEEQWNYEKGADIPLPAGVGKVPDLKSALAVNDDSEIASGIALNRLLVAIIAAEKRGAKGVAPFLSPQLLDEIRYDGGPPADLLNLIRPSGKLPFPAVLQLPTIKELADDVQADFTTAIAPLLAGKPVDRTRAIKLAGSFDKLQAAAQPIIRNLPFEEAVAARRFLNQLGTATTFLKGNAVNGIISPKWVTEGTNVSDLVKRMARFKIFFAPAPAGSEVVYSALHRAMSAYLVVLSNQPKK
jgi:hypothetical protein